MKPLEYEPTRTEQQHKDTCDINKILQRHGKGTNLEPIYDIIDGKTLNFTAESFKEHMDNITAAKNNFQKLPLEIRNRFENSIPKLLRFVQNPANYKEASRMGLIPINDAKETTLKEPSKEPHTSAESSKEPTPSKDS